MVLKALRIFFKIPLINSLSISDIDCILFNTLFQKGVHSAPNTHKIDFSQTLFHDFFTQTADSAVRRLGNFHADIDIALFGRLVSGKGTEQTDFRYAVYRGMDNVLSLE